MGLIRCRYRANTAFSLLLSTQRRALGWVGTRAPLLRISWLGDQCLSPPACPDSGFSYHLHLFVGSTSLPELSPHTTPSPTAFVPLDRSASIKATVGALSAALAAGEAPHKFQNVTLEVRTSSFLAAEGKDPPQCKLALQQRCRSFFASPSRGEIQDCCMIKPWQLCLPSFF